MADLVGLVLERLKLERQVARAFLASAKFGLCSSPGSIDLTFAESPGFIEAVNRRDDVAYVITTHALAKDVRSKAIGCDDPKLAFWSLYYAVQSEKTENVEYPSKILSSVRVGENTVIHRSGVTIGDDCIISDNCVILSGVTIEAGSRVGAGCVIGRDGFEAKTTCFGVKMIPHDGSVILHSDVELGANCTVDKGMFGIATEIGAATKIDSGVHVAHNCNIGEANIITANCVIGGSVTTGRDVFFGLNSTVYNGVQIGDSSFICGGAIVHKDLPSGMKVIPRPGLMVER